MTSTVLSKSFHIWDFISSKPRRYS